MDYPQGDEYAANYLCAFGDYFGVQGILKHIGHFHWRLLHVDLGYLRRSHHTPDPASFDGYYGLTTDARQPTVFSPCPEDRFAALNEPIQPWRREGSEVVVVGFSRKQGEVLGLNPDWWAKALLPELRKHTKRRVVYRPKNYQDLDFRSYLQTHDVWAVVSHSSKAMVEALLEGVPVFPLAPCICGSMGGPIERLDAPVYPAREPFFAWVAYQQWTLAECEQGKPWICR